MASTRIKGAFKVVLPGLIESGAHRSSLLGEKVTLHVNDVSASCACAPFLRSMVQDSSRSTAEKFALWHRVTCECATLGCPHSSPRRSPFSGPWSGIRGLAKGADCATRKIAL